MTRPRAIGPVGTSARLALGVFFLGPYLVLWASPDPADAILGLLLFPLVFLLGQRLYEARIGGRIEATGPGAAVANAAIVVLLFSIELTRPATAMFIGASLILAAWRGYGGCEATAISNWILRRDDQIGCVMLAPFDAVEGDAPSGSPGRERRSATR